MKKFIRMLDSKRKEIGLVIIDWAYSIEMRVNLLAHLF